MPYYLQSSAEPNHIPGPSSAYFISVGKQCPYGNKCYRQRPWIQPYDHGGELHTGKDKPPVHWHIKKNAQWMNGKGERCV